MIWIVSLDSDLAQLDPVPIVRAYLEDAGRSRGRSTRRGMDGWMDEKRMRMRLISRFKMGFKVRCVFVFNKQGYNVM